MWLLRTQRLEHYFGVTYDVYEIYEQDDTGSWVRVEVGGIKDAEARRTIPRAEAQQSKTTKVRASNGGKKGGKGGAESTLADGQLIVTDKLLGPTQFKRRKQTLSPFQQRLNAELELARQRLADRKQNSER